MIESKYLHKSGQILRFLSAEGSNAKVDLFDMNKNAGLVGSQLSSLKFIHHFDTSNSCVSSTVCTKTSYTCWTMNNYF